MRFDFNHWEIVQNKTLHSLLMHAIFFLALLLVDNTEVATVKPSVTKPSVVFDFRETHTSADELPASDARQWPPAPISFAPEDMYKALGVDWIANARRGAEDFTAPIKTIRKIGRTFSALRKYGMILEQVRSRGSNSATTETVEYDYEIDDFYRSVAENWHRTRPIASMNHDLLVQVKFESADNIIINITEDGTDAASHDNTRVFKERAVSAIYAAYQHRAYNIPIGTRLRFRFASP